MIQPQHEPDGLTANPITLASSPRPIVRLGDECRQVNEFAVQTIEVKEDGRHPFPHNRSTTGGGTAAKGNGGTGGTASATTATFCTAAAPTTGIAATPSRVRLSPQPVLSRAFAGILERLTRGL